MTDNPGNPIPKIVREAGSDAIRLKALLRYPDYLVRQAAAVRLGEMGEFHCLASLTDALHDPDAVVREAAARALGQIRDLPNIHRRLSFFETAPDDVVALHALTRALKDREHRVRLAAVNSLKAFGRDVVLTEPGPEEEPGEDDSLPPDKPVYQPYSYPVGEKAWYPRRKTYPPLERDGILPARVLEARYDLVQFRRLLESGDTAEREAVVWALGLMDELDSIPMLVAALKDEEEIVRLSAARSLGMVEIPSSLSRKASPFEDRHEEQMVKDSLVKMLRDPSLEVRRVVVDTLVKQKAPATARYLIDRLKSEDGEMRAVLVQGLGILRDATSIPALLAATDDLDTRVRLAAVEALGHFLQAGGLPPALTERMILVLQSMSMVDVDLAVCQSAGQLVKKYSQNGALELE